MLMIAATQTFLTHEALNSIHSSCKGKLIYDDFDVLRPAGKILFSFIKDGKVYVETSTNIPLDMYVVPGYKFPDYTVTMFGIVDAPADNTLVALNKELRKNSKYYN